MEKHQELFQYYTQYLKNIDEDTYVELTYISLYGKSLEEITNLMESFNSEY